MFYIGFYRFWSPVWLDPVCLGPIWLVPTSGSKLGALESLLGALGTPWGAIGRSLGCPWGALGLHVVLVFAYIREAGGL